MQTCSQAFKAGATPRASRRNPGPVRCQQGLPQAVRDVAKHAALATVAASLVLVSERAVTWATLAPRQGGRAAAAFVHSLWLLLLLPPPIYTDMPDCDCIESRSPTGAQHVVAALLLVLHLPALLYL